MNGELIIRPEWQWAFIYSDKQRDLVVDTVQHGMPLGIMYWMKNPNTGKYKLLGGAEKCLNIRNFSEKDKRRKYAEQGGVCPHCGKQFEYEKMDGDHIIPWAKGWPDRVRQSPDALRWMQPEREVNIAKDGWVSPAALFFYSISQQPM